MKRIINPNNNKSILTNDRLANHLIATRGFKLWKDRPRSAPVKPKTEDEQLEDELKKVKKTLKKTKTKK